jgi:hypothetical protein
VQLSLRQIKDWRSTHHWSFAGVINARSDLARCAAANATGVLVHLPHATSAASDLRLPVAGGILEAALLSAAIGVAAAQRVDRQVPELLKVRACGRWILTFTLRMGSWRTKNTRPAHRQQV